MGDEPLYSQIYQSLETDGSHGKKVALGKAAPFGQPRSLGRDSALISQQQPARDYLVWKETLGAHRSLSPASLSANSKSSLLRLLPNILPLSPNRLFTWQPEKACKNPNQILSVLCSETRWLPPTESKTPGPCHGPEGLSPWPL